MRSPSNVFYTGKSSEKLNGMEKKATHGKEARLTFRTISQCKIHWRGPHVAFAVCSFQRRLSQAINLINPKGESRTGQAMPHIKYMTELRLLAFSVLTFSSYNPDIAKKGASSGGVTPLRWRGDWRARGPNQGGEREGVILSEGVSIQEGALASVFPP